MNTVTFMGNPLHLEGNLPVVGQKAPEFTVCNNGLEPRSLKDYAGKIVVLVSVPSLDTPVCDMEVRRFNKEAAALSDKVQILALSCDLPFAQARWCGAAGVQAVESLSDYKDVDFGKNYGVLIQELRLLARAIFVVAPDGTLAYSQLVPEVTNEPDYDAGLTGPIHCSDASGLPSGSPFFVSSLAPESFLSLSFSLRMQVREHCPSQIIEMLMEWHKTAMSLGKDGLANAPREACRVTSFSG